MGNDNEDMLEISEGNPDKTNSNSSYRGTINSISSGPSPYLPGMYSPNNHVSSSSSTSSTSFTHFHGEEINLHYAPGPFSLLSSNFSGKGNNLTSKIDVKGLTSNGPMANANDDNDNVVGRLHNAIQGLFDLRFKTNENVAIDQQTWSRNNFNMQNMEGISLNGERANNDDYRNKSEGCINLYVRQALLKYNETLSHILEKYSDIRRQGHDQSDAVSEGKVNIRLSNTETVGFRHYNMLRRLSVSLDNLLTTDVLQDQSKFREQINDLTQLANILSIEGVHDENVDTLGKTLKQILSCFDTTTEDSIRTSISSNENHGNVDMDESRGSALSSREIQQERSNDMDLDGSASNLGQFSNESTQSGIVSQQQLNSQNSYHNQIKSHTSLVTTYPWRKALLKYSETLSHILENYSDIGRQHYDQSDAVSEGKVNIRLSNTETVQFRHCNILRRLSVSLDNLLTTDVLQDQSKFREQINDLTQFANILSIEGVHDENVDTLGKTLKQILTYFDTTTEDCLRNTRNDESILPNYTELLSRNSSVASTSSNENHVNADMDESRGSALSSRENQQERSNDMDLDGSASNTGQFRNETTESSTVNRQQVNSQNSDENENKNGEEEEEEEEMELEGYCTDLSVHVSEEGLKAMGLLCSICFNIPRDPVKTSKSYNLYCFKCLDKCHGDPADASSRISKSDYNFDIGDRKVQIENMILKCPHAEKHGCDWTNPLQAWDAHVRDTCAYTKIPCPYCNLPFMRLDMEDHINRQHRYLCKFCEDVSLHPAEELAHLEICPARPVSCPVCGDNGVKQNELRSHIETTHSIEEITSSLLEKESLRNQLIEKQNQTEKELRALKDHNEKYTMTKGKTVYKVFKLSRGTKVCYEGEVIEVINLTGGVNVCFEDGKSMVVQKDYLLFSPPRGIITYKEYLANRASRNYL